MKRRVLAAAATLVAALCVASPAGAETFDNGGASVPIPSGTDPTISVTGMPGPITDINVLFHKLDHGRASEIDIMLISPTGTKLVLMSDACGNAAVNDLDIKFDEIAANDLPAAAPCSSGLYDPTDYEVSEAWPEGPPDALSLDALNGEVANGTWRMIVQDDTAGEVGALTQGWGIEITTREPSITISSGNDAFGAATPSPSELDVVSGRSIVTDVDVLVNGLTHQRGHDIDMFLQAPTGETGWLLSDGCPPAHNLVNWTIDDEATVPFHNGEACFTGSYKPVNYDGGVMDVDTFFHSSAPALPPGDRTLHAFDLVDPDGTWRLWVSDDGEGAAGFVANGWSLDMDTREPAKVNFVVGSQVGPEGSTVSVDLVRGADGATLGRGSIVVATSSGTAQAGSDFTPVSEIVTFEAGQTTKTIAVPITADGPFEPEQDFTIALGQSEGDAIAGTPAALGVTIPADAQQRPDDIPTGNEDKPPPKTFTNTNAITIPAPARRCFRRGARIQFRPKAPEGIAIVRSEVFVNGRKIEDNIGGAAIAPINLTMTGRRIRVRIRLTAHDGRVVTISRTFRRCRTRRSP